MADLSGLCFCMLIFDLHVANYLSNEPPQNLKVHAYALLMIGHTISLCPPLSVQYQLMCALAIVAIQIVLQVIWLRLEPGVVVMDTADPEVTLLQCEYSSYFGPGIAVGDLSRFN